MTAEGLARLKDDLVYRQHPRTDEHGNWLIGYARNLLTHGISENEATYMLLCDLEELQEQLLLTDWFFQLDLIRQDVVLNIAQDRGVDGVFKLEPMIEALQQEDYQAASAHIADCITTTDTDEKIERYQRLATAMAIGTWSW